MTARKPLRRDWINKALADGLIEGWRGHATPERLDYLRQSYVSRHGEDDGAELYRAYLKGAGLAAKYPGFTITTEETP